MKWWTGALQHPPQWTKFSFLHPQSWIPWLFIVKALSTLSELEGKSLLALAVFRNFLKLESHSCHFPCVQRWMEVISLDHWDALFRNHSTCGQGRWSIFRIGGGGQKLEKCHNFRHDLCANLQYNILPAERAAKFTIVYVSSIFMLNLMVCSDLQCFFNLFLHYILWIFQVVKIIGGGGGKTICLPPPPIFSLGGQLPPRIDAPACGVSTSQIKSCHVHLPSVQKANR